MTKTLSEVDSVYKQIQNLSKAERLEYCENLIDRSQKILSRNIGFLTKDQKDHLSEIISLAQEETQLMQKENNST